MARGVVLGIVLALLLGGYAGEQDGPPIDWAKVGVAGKTFELIDDERHESLRFNPSGIVSATYGVRDGPVTAPLYHWKVQARALQLLEHPEGPIKEQLSLLSLNDGEIIVRLASGKRAKYQVKSNAAYPSLQPTLASCAGRSAQLRAWAS